MGRAKNIFHYKHGNGEPHYIRYTTIYHLQGSIFRHVEKTACELWANIQFFFFSYGTIKTIDIKLFSYCAN